MNTAEKIAIVFVVVALAYTAGHIHASVRPYRHAFRAGYRDGRQDAQMAMASGRVTSKGATVGANQPTHRHRAPVPTQAIPTYAPGTAGAGHRVR